MRGHMRPAHAVDLNANDVAWFEKLAKTLGETARVGQFGEPALDHLLHGLGLIGAR